MSKQKLIQGLTGLRGVAACWVVLFHLYSEHGAPLEGGYLGVDIFFILSGFVLSYVYAQEFQSKSSGAYVAFLTARVARIFPLHLAMLAVLGLIVVWLPGFADAYPKPHERFGLGPFIAAVFLVQNWFHFLPGCWNTP